MLDIELNKQQIKILNTLYKKKFILQDSIEKTFNCSPKSDLFYTLVRYQLVRLNLNDKQKPRMYYLSEEGKAYVEKTKQNKFKYWFPIILANTLSVLAIIISIISLFQ